MIGALMIGAMLTNVVLQRPARGRGSARPRPACPPGPSCPGPRLPLAVAVALAASRLFGPVLASAAEGFWLLDAPISRASLLRPATGRGSWSWRWSAGP